MIVLTIIIFTILVLLIILNIRKDGFVDISDTDLQTQINYIKNIQEQRASADNNLYYYPYNDIYNKYKNSMITYLCKKKKEVDGKTKFDEDKLELLENQYQNLRRKISPEFNPIFSDFVQLNAYDNNNNKKHNFLKVKRYTDNSVNPPTTFQVYTTNDDTKCLEVDNYNRYASVDCDSKEDKQRFYLDYAYDKASYEDIVKNPRFRYPEKAELLNYPITLLRSKTGNCVNLYNDNVSIEPCKYKTSQMFKMKPI
jgi:hypothetical protein